VTAHQKSTSRSSDVVQLASDLRFQFEMAFRHNERDRDARLEQLDNVMAAWQASTQSDADRGVLVTWLQAAGASSLPGALRDLPAAPEFSKVQPPLEIVAEHRVQKVPAVEGIVIDQVEQDVEIDGTGFTETGFTEKETALLVESPAQTPITPTAADPLEEEMISLRQPPSLELGERNAADRQSSETAPRPGVSAQPQLIEENLLTSLPTEPSETVQPTTANVNLTELAARIAGYHDALDEVETALLRMETASLDLVTAQIHQLESMTRDYSFVELYYESLTAAERQGMLAPRAMTSTLAEVKRQLDRCEATLDGDFLGSFDEAAEKEIAALRRKLADIEQRIKS
jgi:hypothetical protein